MPRIFWLALLLGYVAGIAGAVLFLPGPMVEPLYAGIAIASLGVGAGVFALVLGSEGRARPAAFGLAQEAAGILPEPTPEMRAEEETRPETGAPVRLIATVEEHGVSAAELREILHQGRVDAFVRPLVGVRQPQAEFQHAVARLWTARGEPVEPARFRPTAARCGLGGVIDRLLVTRCADALRGAQEDGRDQQIFCKILPSSLNDAGFLAEIGGLLREEYEIARRLILELEQIRLHLPAREAVAELVGQGLRLCLWRLGLDGLEPATLAGYGFEFVRIESPQPAVSAKDPRLDPRLLTLRQVLAQAGITLVLDQKGAPRRPLEVPARPGEFRGEPGLRSASVA